MKSTKRSIALAMMGTVSATSLVAHAGGTTTWNSVTDGSWLVGANWDTGLVPDDTDSVLLGLSGAYTVSLPGTGNALSVSITNPDAILHIDNARVLNIFGNLSNNGTVVVNPVSGGSATFLDFEADATISGSGEIQLNAFASRSSIRSGSGVSVTQSAGHTILGYGQIAAALTNNGLVNSDVSANAISMVTNDKTNNSTMRASSGGILSFTSIMLTQGGSGVLEAVDMDSRVDLTSTTIVGGELRTEMNSTIEIITSTLDGVNFSGGTINLQNSRTLDIFNSITNDGTIVVNSANGASATQIDFENSGSFNGSGTVQLNSFASRARLRTGPGATMTNTSTHTVFGLGQIEAEFINDGLVSADVMDQEIFFRINDKQNNSTMQAINGAGLDFGSITITQSSSAELLADGAGSHIDFTGSALVGGNLRTSNDASVEVLTCSMTGVTFEGLMNIQNSRSLDIFDSITNNGTIVVNPVNGGSATQIDFENSGSFLGSGAVKLNSFGSRSRLRTTNGSTMTNSSTHMIHGFGQIEADLINNGLVSADTLDQELFFQTDPKLNNARMEAVSGGTLDFATIEVNQSSNGIIEADGAGTRIDMTGTTLIGGVLSTINGGVVEVLTATLDDVEFSGDLNIQNSRTLNIRNGVINNGTIIVNSVGGGSATQIQLRDKTELGGTGTIVLNGFSARARITKDAGVTQGVLGSGQRVMGIGSIDADILHHGTTAPGLSIGTMLATQPITYSDSSVFEAEVDDTTGDLLDSNSTIAVDGTLQVIYTDGFSPAGFWSRKIMEGSSISGKFDAVDVPAPASGFVTRVYNTGSELFVGQTCPSDTNLDGMLNFFDVSQFLSDFTSMDPNADLNNDGMWNFFDVSIFLNNFTFGC